MPTTPTTPLVPVDQAACLSMRDAAHVYAEAGHPVFPCWPGTKRPAVTHSFQEATTNARRIEGWWRWQPDANIALRTGDRVDVLDIDVHTTGDGFTALQRLLDSGLASQWSHAVRSPNGGLHLYYPANEEHPQRNWNREMAHMDFRGTGGYIIAPPSRVLVQGVPRPYEPVGPSYPGRPIEADRVRELLTPPRPPMPDFAPTEGSQSERAAGLAGWLAGFEGSNRNEALFWSACRLVEAGATETDTYATLAEPAARLGLTEQETVATIRNAHRVADPESGQPTTSRAVTVGQNVRSLR